MQNNYDDWGDEASSASSSSQRTGTGGWHWLLSLVAIVTVALLSFAMA